MEHDPTRLLRLRSRDPRAIAALGLSTALAPRGTPRFLGQVVGGAGMPTGTDRVYLLNPVRLDGLDAEGATASLAVDGARTIPVVVIGGTPPQAGDLLVALAVGGRWVAESRAGSSPPVLYCSPCNIPKKNLTLSWTNLMIGDVTELATGIASTSASRIEATLIPATRALNDATSVLNTASRAPT